MFSTDLFQFQEELPKLHQFHFVLSTSMKENLKNLIFFRGSKSLSGRIVKILSVLAPHIKREHDWGEERMSKYNYVSPDPMEKRMHVYAYLPEDLYRELKLIHQDLNFFSIAQIVRLFLELFLYLVKKYGDNVLEELENIYKVWEKEVIKNKLTICQVLQQLRKIIQHLPVENRLITVYDGHFSPFWRFRL